MIRFPDAHATAPFANTRLQDWSPATSVYGALRDSVARHADRTALGVGRHDVVAYMLSALVETQIVLRGAEMAGIALSPSSRSCGDIEANQA